MRKRLWIGCLPALGLAAPVTPIPPPIPPPTYHHYGPVRLCAPGPSPLYAIDVHEDEAGHVQEHEIGVSQEGGGFGIGLIAGSGVSRMVPDPAQPAGEIEIEGAGTAERIRLPDGAVRYRIATGDPPYAQRIEIRSGLFDGSGNDRALIGRIRFGAAAQVACANVPPELAATPERRDDLAVWISPKRHSGPLTLCWEGLAIDVGADETARLPWHRHFAMAIIEKGPQQVMVTSGLHPAASPRAWPAVAGAVADDPRFEAQLWQPGRYGFNVLLPRPAAERVRVMTRAERERFGPDGGAHVTFSFVTAPSESDRVAFVRRLRSQTAGERCFDPDRR